MQRVLQRLMPTCERVAGMRMRVGLQDVSIVQPTQALKELEDFRPLDTDCERILILPNILLADDCKKPPVNVLKTDSKCTKKTDSKRTKKADIKCKHPSLRPKEVPLFQYGRCKDKEPPMNMACPSKANKGPATCDVRDKGPKAGGKGAKCKKGYF